MNHPRPHSSRLPRAASNPAIRPHSSSSVPIIPPIRDKMSGSTARLRPPAPPPAPAPPPVLATAVNVIGAPAQARPKGTISARPARPQTFSRQPSMPLRLGRKVIKTAPTVPQGGTIPAKAQEPSLAPTPKLSTATATSPSRIKKLLPSRSALSLTTLASTGSAKPTDTRILTRSAANTAKLGVQARGLSTQPHPCPHPHLKPNAFSQPLGPKRTVSMARIPSCSASSGPLSTDATSQIEKSSPGCRSKLNGRSKSVRRAEHTGYPGSPLHPPNSASVSASVSSSSSTSTTPCVPGTPNFGPIFATTSAPTPALPRLPRRSGTMPQLRDSHHAPTMIHAGTRAGSGSTLNLETGSEHMSSAGMALYQDQDQENEQQLKDMELSFSGDMGISMLDESDTSFSFVGSMGLGSSAGVATSRYTFPTPTQRSEDPPLDFEHEPDPDNGIDDKYAQASQSQIAERINVDLHSERGNELGLELGIARMELEDLRRRQVYEAWGHVRAAGQGDLNDVRTMLNLIRGLNLDFSLDDGGSRASRAFEESYSA